MPRVVPPALAVVAALAVAVPITAASASTTGTPPLRPAATSVLLTGAGFGHGVGLSQYGAYGQALDGRTAEQILPWYYKGTRVAGVDDERDIRVNVAHRVARLALAAQAVATGGGSWRLTVGTRRVDLGGGDSAWVSASGGALTLHVVRGDGATTAVTGPSVLAEWGGGAGALAGAPATVLHAGADLLRHGTLTVLPSSTAGGSGDLLEAVTALSLHDEYLYGLAEMPSSWPREALRAQAIAARTYALGALRAHPGGISTCACDVYDTDASQVFTGWRKESETVNGIRYGDRWKAAVDATTTANGQGLAVLDSAGRPIQAFYFSSSGGRTRNSEWVWSTPLPYAVSVDDHWSLQSINPLASWTTRLTGTQVAAAFGLRSLAALTITARDGSGAVRTVVATDAYGVQRTLSGETFRSWLGLRSSWVRTAALTMPPAPTPTPVPPTATPTPSSSPRASDAPALPAVYSSPGRRTVNGRRWITTCSRRSGTLHCAARRYDTWWAKDAKHPGRVVRRSGYRAAAVADTAPVTSPWARSRWAAPGSFRDASGARWRVTCSAASGPRTCTSERLEPVIVRMTSGSGHRFVSRATWTTRRLVRLTRR